MKRKLIYTILAPCVTAITLSSCFDGGGGGSSNSDSGLDGNIPSNFVDSTAKSITELAETSPEKAEYVANIVVQGLRPVLLLLDFKDLVKPFSMKKITKAEENNNLPNLILENEIDFTKELSKNVQNSKDILYRLEKVKGIIDEYPEGSYNDKCSNQDQGGTFTITDNGNIKEANFENCKIYNNTFDGKISIEYTDSDNDNIPNKIEMIIDDGFKINVENKHQEVSCLNAVWDPTYGWICDKWIKKEEEIVDILSFKKSSYSIYNENGSNLYERDTNTPDPYMSNLYSADIKKKLSLHLSESRTNTKTYECYDNNNNNVDCPNYAQDETKKENVKLDIEFDGKFNFENEQLFDLTGNLQKLYVEIDKGADGTVDSITDVNNAQASIKAYVENNENKLDLSIKGSLTMTSLDNYNSFSIESSELTLNTNGKDLLNLKRNISTIKITPKNNPNNQNSEVTIKDADETLKIENNTAHLVSKIGKFSTVEDNITTTDIQNLKLEIDYDKNIKQIDIDFTIGKADINQENLKVSIGQRIKGSYKETDQGSEISLIVDEGNNKSFVETIKDNEKHTLELENGLSLTIKELMDSDEYKISGGYIRTIESVKEGNEFVEKSRNGIMLDNFTIKRYKNEPKITLDGDLYLEDTACIKEKVKLSITTLSGIENGNGELSLDKEGKIKLRLERNNDTNEIEATLIINGQEEPVNINVCPINSNAE